MNRREMLKSAGAAVAVTVSPVASLASETTDGSAAYYAFKQALQADPEWAWTYHCNLACAAMDEGMRGPAANRAAARFMKAAFGIDTLAGVHKEMGDDVSA